MLQVKEESFTVIDVFKSFRGEKTAKEYNTIEYFERYLNKLKKLINIDIKLATWKKFEYVKKHVKSFIKWQYKSADYPLKDLKQQFLNEEEIYTKYYDNSRFLSLMKSYRIKANIPIDSI